MDKRERATGSGKKPDLSGSARGTGPHSLATAHELWSRSGGYRPDLSIYAPAQAAAIEWLIKIGEERLQSQARGLNFETGNPKAEALLNDIDRYPHLFLLGCLMDRQIPAARAWGIPYAVGDHLGSFDFEAYAGCSADRIAEIFVSRRLHRFSGKAGLCFHAALQVVATRCNGDAAGLWSGGVPSALVVRRFLEFDGVGIKIASMAANILAREFQVPMADYASIDIAPDVRTMRFFTHHGLLRPKAKREELVYLARELYPIYPGILDIGAWEWDRKAGQGGSLPQGASQGAS